MKNWNPFSLSQWLAWIGATLVATLSGAAGLLSYADGRFENKEQAALKSAYKQEQLNEIKHTLDKIDAKVDRLIQRR